MRFVERSGVESLSMPKLAQELGIGVTSIYWYFKNKEALIERLTVEAARQFQQLLAPVKGSSWPDHLSRLFRRMRIVLRENDLLCDLLFMRSSHFSAEALTYLLPQIEESLQLMVDGGFTPEQALQNHFTLSHYTRGCVVLERQMRQAGVLGTVPTPVPEEFPLLARVTRHQNLRGADEATFLRGLTGVIEGMAAVNGTVHAPVD